MTLGGKLVAKPTRVIMIDANSDQVKEFETQTEAATALGIDSWHIHAALRGTKGGSRLLENKGISFVSYEEYHDLKPIREHRVRPGDSKRKAKRVHAIDMYTHEIIDTYDSMTEAAEDTDTNAPAIRKSCIKEGITAAGYKWEFAD